LEWQGTYLVKEGYMEQLELLSRILDSWNKSVVFVDNDHIIRYMNKPAEKHYARWGNVIGKSLFECHNESSQATIKDAYARLKDGCEEVLIVNNRKQRVYIRGVRDTDGNLLGYYERYDPPE
jgi:DUF438 domain-containing protein